MKNFLFLIFYSVSLVGSAQFSESFFERMNPSYSKPGHFFGTEISNGALGVRFADSVDTEVQWAKLDLHGNFQTYSAHLPNDFISPNERIIEVYESGINQFIVTQDSASSNPEGIRVYKYENYTQSAGVFEFPVQLRNAYFQSYFMYGKIYVFYVESGVGMKRLKINPTTLALEENLFLGAFAYDVQPSVKHYKLTHVMFQDENNMQVFASSGQNLVRINIVNNVPNAIETKNIGLVKIMGINYYDHQIVCMNNSSNYEIKKYSLIGTQNLANAFLLDSIDLPQITSSSFNWKFATNNSSNEIYVVADAVPSGKICFFENNELIYQKDNIHFNSLVHLEFINDFPLIFGNRSIRYFYQDNFALAITFGDDLFNFKEYNAIYEFGEYNFKFGVGLNPFQPINGNSRGEFLFTNMVYAAGLKISGKEDGAFYGNDLIYENGSYKMGPYTNETQYDHNIIHRFNESFYVDQDMLNYHVYAIENNISTYIIPRGIMEWPAHGDISKGQASNLAPFVDINQDGHYNPEQGEYPTFPGTRCLLNICHQHATDWQNTGTGLEIHSYAYNFECNDTISEVIFYRTEVFNRSSRNYDSLAIGIFSDLDLGNYNDDYVGTNVENGMVYAYNGDGFDEGVGFLDSLPTIGNMLLKGNKMEANFSDDSESISTSINGFGFSDGIFDNEYKGLEYSTYFTSTADLSQADPINSIETFNYVTGKWRYGDTLYFGGTGFEGSAGLSNIPAKFTFPGESDPLFFGTNGVNPGFVWNEELNANLAGDRRLMASFGSTSLSAGEKVEYHFAYLAGKRVPGMGQSQIDLFAKAAHVKNAFNSNLTPCGQTFDNLTEDQITSVSKKEVISFVKLYPNPSNDQINIQIPPGNQAVDIEICDINGKVYLTSSLKSTLNTLDISDLKNGLYFVKISLNGKTEIAKFIKN